MKKYTFEYKLKVVNEYLNGNETYESLAEKYQLSTPTNVVTWVRLYKQFGKEGLKEAEKQSVFPVQFKLDVIRYKERTGLSYQKTADAFGIRFGTTVSGWYKTVQRDGVEALKETRGRPPMAEIERRKKEKEKLKKRKIKEFDAKRLAELERENELLRLENSYLKKLETFQDKRLPEKNKQKRRTNLSRKDLN
ncbi:helix-turn-helix domain-containing protein [Alkalibacterium sp. MB6]|uniref:helix-turn-helix domain-containing protein n=1 Tax=Alkalibacterium sp. MB6 TaxID=2081965 RepID=UPI0013794E84|nr:helix-turn-helix domain-containing protein [Alkalibacterium sp. MB6]